MIACGKGHLSIVEMLINHDNGLLECEEDRTGATPLLAAIGSRRSRIVRFLLARGANVCATTTHKERTALMIACNAQSARIVRLVLGADVDVEARDLDQQTAFDYAANYSHFELMIELFADDNAVVDENEDVAFNTAMCYRRYEVIVDVLLEHYGNKLTQDYGRLALHAFLGPAEISLAEDEKFHPPLSLLRICTKLGKLEFGHFRTLIHSLDIELIRNRDDSGMLPIHLACQANAPIEVLSVFVEIDPATLHMADHKGALPIHYLCGSGAPTEYSGVRYLVKRGGVGTLAARNRDGALPLHALCGSTDPPLRTVQYLIQCFPGSVAARAKNGQYPFMVAACDSSTASLSVVYELVRKNPGLLVPVRTAQELPRG